MKGQREKKAGQEKMILRLNGNDYKQTGRHARHSVQQMVIYDKVTFVISSYSAITELQAGGILKVIKSSPSSTASAAEAQEQGMQEGVRKKQLLSTHGGKVHISMPFPDPTHSIPT